MRLLICHGLTQDAFERLGIFRLPFCQQGEQIATCLGWNAIYQTRAIQQQSQRLQVGIEKALWRQHTGLHQPLRDRLRLDHERHAWAHQMKPKQGEAVLDVHRRHE